MKAGLVESAGSPIWKQRGRLCAWESFNSLAALAKREIGVVLGVAAQAAMQKGDFLPG